MAADWERVRARYPDGLTDEGCRLLIEATSDNIYYKNGVVQVLRGDGMKARKLAAKLRPLVMTLKSMAGLMKVSTQVSDEITDSLWFLWGSLRILIVVDALEGVRARINASFVDELKFPVSTSSTLKRWVMFKWGQRQERLG